jgi:hypothetical protein
MSATSRLTVALLVLHVFPGLARAELTVSEVVPANHEVGVCVDAPLRLSFNEIPVSGSQGRVLIKRVSDGSVVDAIDLAATNFTDNVGGRALNYQPVRIEGNVVSIYPHSHTLGYSGVYRVEIEPGVLRDRAGNAFKGFGIDSPWEFTTKAAVAKGRTNLVVAADCKGDFCTVQGAIDYVPDDNQVVTDILIRKGTYDGMVYIAPGKDHIHLRGEDRKQSILSGGNNDRLNPTRMGRALVSVEANDFVAENLTMHNTTPYRGSQAEALRVNGDKCILRNCDFLSFQDTVLLSGRVYVTNCYVEGDVDFIWGQGTAFFEQCEIKAVHDGYYLQARNSADHAGYVFLNCKLTAAPGVQRCWLARIDADRFPNSEVVFVNCRMGPQVPPAGWQVTGTNLAGLGFREFHSTDLDGKPLDVSRRHPASRQLDAAEAAAVSDAARIFGRESPWNPARR